MFNFFFALLFFVVILLWLSGEFLATAYAESSPEPESPSELESMPSLADPDRMTDQSSVNSETGSVSDDIKYIVGKHSRDKPLTTEVLEQIKVEFLDKLDDKCPEDAVARNNYIEILKDRMETKWSLYSGQVDLNAWLSSDTQADASSDVEASVEESDEKSVGESKKRKLEDSSGSESNPSKKVKSD